MNKILLSCAILYAGLAVQAQQKFTITGKLTELKTPQKITLKYRTGEKMVMDTTMMINGAFSFSGKVQYPVKASLFLIPLRSGTDKGYQRLLDMEGTQNFFVEPGKIIVSGKKNMKDALIKGGKTQGEYLLLQQQLKPLHDQKIESDLRFQQLLRQKKEEAIQKFGPELTYAQQSDAVVAAKQEMPPGSYDIQAKITKVEHDFIRQHPDSYVSFDFVRNYSGTQITDPKTFESLCNSLSRRLRDTEEGRRLPLNRFRALLIGESDLAVLKSNYAKLSSQYKNTSLATEAAEIANLYLREINLIEAAVTAIGAIAPPITKLDINGNPVNWESFNGKYLLLDFWSSWCVPCRGSHPHLKELYTKYQDKGFEILGIADQGGSSTLEHKETLWKAAIKKDGLPWPQVLNDIGREKFDVCEAYGIWVYCKVLLDKEGKIMGHYYNNPEDQAKLDQQLKEAFGF